MSEEPRNGRPGPPAPGPADPRAEETPPGDDHSARTDATPPGPPLEPITSLERHDSLDVLRGFAVLGILAMNIYFFGLPARRRTAIPRCTAAPRAPTW